MNEETKVETIKFQDIWDVLSKIDCSGHTEKKKTGRDTELTYLSWTWAWTETMKRYPEATYKVREWEGRPWLDDPVAGCMVMTEVDIGGNVRPMWLAVMDGANNALKREAYSYTVKGYNGTPVEKKVAKVDMCAINKAIMRCLVKNLAMFGLGLNIYAGEDLPVGIEEEPENKTDAKTQPKTTTQEKKTADKPKPGPKMKAAWKAFQELSEVKAMPEVSRSNYFKVLVKQQTGKDDPYAADDAEWDKFMQFIDNMKAL